MLLADQLNIEGNKRVEVKKDIHEEVLKLMGRYEAELYQDRYLPEYQRQMREVSRREKEMEEEKRRRDQAALDRVAEFSDDAST